MFCSRDIDGRVGGQDSARKGKRGSQDGTYNDTCGSFALIFPCSSVVVRVIWLQQDHATHERNSRPFDATIGGLDSLSGANN
jgi:hypothetical protein